MRRIEGPLPAARLASKAAPRSLCLHAEEIAANTHQTSTVHASNPVSPAIASSTSDATVTGCVADPVRGARLLHSFLNRRRLCLLKSETVFSTADKLLFTSDNNGTPKATKVSGRPHESGRHEEDNKHVSDDQADGRDVALSGRASAACVSVAPADAGLALPHSSSGAAIPVFVVTEVYGKSAPAESCSLRLPCRYSIADKEGSGAAHVTQENPVEAVLRPFSKLRLQLAPAAAAAAAVSCASTIASDNTLVTTYGDACEQKASVAHPFHTDQEEMNASKRTDSACEAIKSTASGLRAKVWKTNSPAAEHVPRELTNSTVSHGKRSLSEELTTSCASNAGGAHRSGRDDAATEARNGVLSGTLRKRQQLRGEHQSLGQPRRCDSSDKEDLKQVQQRHILAEQEKTEVANAKAAAAVLRRKVRSLQAENDLLVLQCSYGVTQSSKQERLGRCLCSPDACSKGCNMAYNHKNYSGRAAAGVPSAFQRQPEAYEEIQLLKQQLAICRREVYVLSQENELLRELRNEKFSNQYLTCTAQCKQ